MQRLYLRTLWEETGGEKDTIHEFWQEVRRRGLRISYPRVAFFLRSEPISAEVKRRLEELWADHQSTADDLLARAKAAKIPVTSAQVEKFGESEVEPRQMNQADRVVVGVRRDGSEFPIEASISRVRRGGQASGGRRDRGGHAKQSSEPQLDCRQSTKDN